jgi:predicted 3-demethylubiquinone-9 3-methyltransferase (glyoxalase superfamily)
MSKIVPHLWYAQGAEEAARLYVSLLPDSRIDSVTTMPAEGPSGPEGSVQIVEFTLAGQPYVAFSAWPMDQFTHAISLMILCDTQEEIDRLWDALSEGGSTSNAAG